MLNSTQQHLANLLLDARPQPVSEGLLAEFTGIKPATVRQYIQVLREAGMLICCTDTDCGANCSSLWPPHWPVPPAGQTGWVFVGFSDIQKKENLLAEQVA